MSQRGAPLAGALVLASPTGEFQHTFVPRARTDAGGRFILSGLPWGKYVVSASKESDDYPNGYFALYGRAPAPTVTLSLSAPEANLAIHLGPKAGVLTGRVSDSVSGAPLEATFAMEREGHPHSMLSVGQRSEYRILIPPSVAVDLRVTAPGHKAAHYRDIKLATGAVKRLDIRLVPTADGQESQIPLKALIAYGRKLFVARFTSQDGFGHAAEAPQAAPRARTEASLTVRSPGGPQVRVKFYRRGPLRAKRAGQPPDYFFGVSILRKRHVVARWQAEPTTIPTFYERLNTAMPAASGQVLITAAVQYGGRFLKLWALTWAGRGSIQQRNAWTGQDFSLMKMGTPPKLVLVAVPENYDKVPDLYEWEGTRFRAANSAFPEYFGSLAVSEAGPIYDLGSQLPAQALLESCRRAMEAYARAGKPGLGRAACEQARERIQTGHGVSPGVPRETKQAFELERKRASEEIDALLRRAPGGR